MCLSFKLYFSDASKHVIVFPYSIFYVFYEQYLTMVADTAISLAISLSAVFAVTFLLGGLDVKAALVTTFTIILIVVSCTAVKSSNLLTDKHSTELEPISQNPFLQTNLIGLMYWWSVTLNAISLVNLVMASGISVEFCSHIIRDFQINDQTVSVSNQS